MSRSPEYTQGRRAGIKWAVDWLHERAKQMNDPRARDVLNSAAYHMGLQRVATDASEPALRAQFAAEGKGAVEFEEPAANTEALNDR